MKSLNEDLKTGKFKQIYLLYGSEGYLKKQYKERFIKSSSRKARTSRSGGWRWKEQD